MRLKNTYQTRKRFTKVPVSKTGMWYQDGDVVVPSNQITMKGPNGEPNYFNSPILGTGMQSGQTQVMYPGREYSFPNDNFVYERKMQSGGINLTEEISSLNPNYKKNNFKNILNTADLVTDAMQMGHFIPHPVGQAVGYIGDVLGAGVDIAQSGINIAEGDYQGAAVNAALGILPGVTGTQGYKRANSLMTGKGSGMYRPLQALPHLRNNPVIQKGLMWNKATLGANAAEISSNLNFNNNQTNMFGGYRDNTNISPVVRPVRPKMQFGGVADPEFMFKNKYNTQLTPEEEVNFSKWVSEESKRQGRNIINDIGAYDMKGFWKSGDYKNMDSDNHGTDTWKKPNHPTFSNQSRYHGADGWYGGNWIDKGGYQPSKQTLETYGPEYYDWMFKSEPGRSEYLDMSRYESGANAPTPFVYQNGGRTPIYVSNPNDPRLKSYNDSLSLYNRGLKPNELKTVFNQIENDSDFRYYRKASKKELNSFPGKIKPIAATKFEMERFMKDRLNNPNLSYSYYPIYDNQGNRVPNGIAVMEAYKKPVQPVKYADPKIVAKQQQLMDAGYNIGVADGIWGPKSQQAWNQMNTLKQSNVNTSFSTSIMPVRGMTEENIDALKKIYKENTGSNFRSQDNIFNNLQKQLGRRPSVSEYNKAVEQYNVKNKPLMRNGGLQMSYLKTKRFK